ncbi:MAG: hypothetical protein ACLVJ3_02780, partial [Coprococcus phoceensis]
VFHSLFEKELTGNEIDFIIALTHLQNGRGEAFGVHYKEMCEKMDISVQAFYDCKKSLAQKGVIQVTKGQKDYDIVLCGNDFTSYTDRDYKAGNVPYIRTNQKLFYDVNWKKLKPAQKLLIMDLLNINEAGKFRTHRIKRENFIKKYANTVAEDGSVKKGLLDINARTLQSYLKMLKLYFYVGIKDGMYLITLRKQFSEKVVQSEHKQTYEYLLQVACRRNKIKQPDQKEYKDILQLLLNYRKRLWESFINPLDIFPKMLRIINDRVMNPRKWMRRLKASLFHKLLREDLGIA